MYKYSEPNFLMYITLITFLSFCFLFIYLFIYLLFIFGCVGSSLRVGFL